MARQTVEDYVSEIVCYVEDADFEQLVIICVTLERMKSNSKPKHKLNYWRVMQCLGEVASDMLVEFLVKLEKKSCKCHLSTNFKCFMQLFAESMCNAKVIKRILTNRAQVVPVMFKAIRQNEDFLLRLVGLRGIQKLLIVGRTELIEYFFKYGLMKDLFQLIKVKNDTSHFASEAVGQVWYSTKILHTVSICGSEKIRSQVKRSNVTRLIGEYIVQLAMNKVVKQSVSSLCDCYEALKNMLGDPKEADSLAKSWKSRINQLLQVELEQEELYLFCSSPNCRKTYAETDGFRYCGACRLARYCSELCQKEHWKKGHKDACQGAIEEFTG